MIRHYASRFLIAILATYLSLSLVDLYVSRTLPPLDFKAKSPFGFRPEVGFMFPPMSVVGCTDRFEFAVEQTTNSLGFLDRDHALEKPSDVVRLLVLGDSFVEACQVSIAEKFTTLLEQELNDAVPERRFEVIAMGRSGAGTVDEVAFYDFYGKHFDPDLVIIVFVGNDFANNSPILEAVRNGWHPYHPPHFFIEKIKGQKRFRPIWGDPKFLEHKLSEERPVGGSPTFLRRHLGWSGIFRWISKRFEARRQQATYASEMARNVVSVRGLGIEFQRQLEGWRYPQDSDVDYMFYADDLPAVFQNAVDATEFSLSTFSARLGAEDRRLLIVSVDSLLFDPPASPGGRRLRRDGYLSKVRRIADASGIPLLDLHDSFQRRGDPRKAHWTYDGHWNELGHRWAAEAVLEHLLDHPELIRPRTPVAEAAIR